MSNISFVLFSFNEENRIEYIVRNLRPYGEVLILDGGSTDRTQEIAERFGAKFVLRPASSAPMQETQAMLDFVKSIVKTEWIFWSMVDNFLPKQLLEKMTEISKQSIFKYVFVPIDTYMWGEIEHPVISASYPNFFHKDFVDFKDNRIHGMGKFIGTSDQILHLPIKKEYSIRHYSLYDVNKFVSKHLQYAIAEAKMKNAEGKKFTVFYMLGSMLNYFWLFYKRGWRAGVRGFYGALLYSFFRLMVAVKLYEEENSLNLETIEKAFRQGKAEIVNEIELKNNL